jgi:predicted ATPase/class 3 adenylate cyclase
MLPEPQAAGRHVSKDSAQRGSAVRHGKHSEASPEHLTLLFTDIEGSTQLLEALGDRYSEVLSRHFELLREAVSGSGGQVVDAHSDALFAVFQHAEDAIAAAVRAQRLLYEENWAGGARLRVRMGIHTGDPQPVLAPEISYVGIDVHRAARICEVAHGGQIVISNVTRSAIEGKLPFDVKLRDLGTHRLKDIRYPETLTDLVIDDLPSHFAPIRSLDNHPTNLPTALTPFIGRAAEKIDLLTLMRDKDVRMLTLTGPGGSGKTRLSIEVAKNLLEDFPDGVFQVQLASVSQHRLVAPTIAQTLGITEFPGRPVIDTIKQVIGRRKILLVIDNFEQVVPAAPLLQELLNDCPNLKLLMTSREPLNVSAEREYPVLAMKVPDSVRQTPDNLMSCDAVRLLVDRVHAVRRDFKVDAETTPILAEICRRVDGLPLAIELVAPRLRVLDPPALLERLTERLDTLGRDEWALSGRHHAMRNAITWSYNLLDDVEQQFFCAASVFAGGFSLESAESILKDTVDDGDILEHLISLVRKSLMYRDTVEGVLRLRMLETIRDYGREKLKETGRLADMRRRHMEHMLGLVEQMAPDLTTRNQRKSVSKLLVESDNIRTALEFALETRNGNAISRFVKSLLWLWISRSQFTEGEAWITRALVRTGDLVGERDRAIVTDVAGWLKLIEGDWSGALPFFQECRPIYERLDLPNEYAMSLMLEGITRTIATGDQTGSEQVSTALEKFRKLGNETGLGLTLTALGEGARLEGRFAQAEEYFSEALENIRSAGNTYWTVALLENLAHVRLQKGDWTGASQFLEEALELGEDYEDPTYLFNFIAATGQVALIRGRPEDAARLFGAAAGLLTAAGIKFAPADQAQFEANMESARDHLGDVLYQERFAEGAAWSPAQAMSATVSLRPYMAARRAR